MLTSMPDLPEEIVGVTAEGQVTGADYRRTWRPLLAAARQAREDLRVLYHLGPEFDGFTGGALWEDLRLGFEYLHDLERCAVVSDRQPLRVAAELAGAMVPCSVRAFEEDEMDEAVEWLTSSEEEALSFRILPECGVLLLEPDETTTREDVAEVQEALQAWSTEHDRIDALVIVPVDGSVWKSPAEALRHWQLLCDTDGRLERVAVVADGATGEIVSAVGDTFTSAEVRAFDASHRAAAVSWAAGRRTPAAHPATDG